MNTKNWELAGFTDLKSQLGRSVSGSLITVPQWLSLTPDKREIVWDGGPPAAKERARLMKPGRDMLDAFIGLWNQEPDAILRFARKWGVLYLDKSGRPCRPIGPAERREPIDAWHYFSRRAQAVVNIAANLRIGKLGELDDWRALCDTESRTGGLLQELDRVEEPLNLTLLARIGYPFGVDGRVDRRYKRTVEMEVYILAMEVTLWLRMGRVGFTMTNKKSGWSLVLSYNSCMLAAIALQLALVLADVEALYQCSGCHEPYVRKKRAPKSGQANFCDKCGRTKALQRADEKRRAKRDQARRLADEGVAVEEIAKRLHSRPQTVTNWIGKAGDPRARRGKSR